MTVTPIRAGTVRRRLGAQDGFTMLLAIGVLALTALLITAVWLAVSGDTSVTQQDLEGKRAYAAAQAAANVFLYDLNQNPNYWATCSNDAQSETPVPGSTTSEEYSWQALGANGNSYSACTSTDVQSTLIDNATGNLLVEFTGYAGNPNSVADKQVKRTIVASFREKTPFDFLWYTVYEALDSSINGLNDCNQFYRTGKRPSACNIVWGPDTINGPMYTEDQYLIAPGYTPTFGRNSSDQIESAAPGTAAADICGGDNCESANIKGTAAPNAPLISPPSSNQFLATDAASYGVTYSGTTNVVLNGSTATVTNCQTSTCSSPTTVNLATDPVIYVSNASGCSPQSYSPFGTTYTLNSSGEAYGCAGDVYVSGTYSQPVTIGAANDIVITGDLTDTTPGGSSAPTGTATLGLVANEFIRVEHGVSGCGGSSIGSNVSGQYTQNLDIDAAIMAVQHSFIVDNYNCGPPMGTLTIYGAVAQYFRGAVATAAATGSSGSVSVVTGYAKNYNYDSRLSYLLPPYLFDISNAGWELTRETNCGGASGSSGAC